MNRHILLIPGIILGLNPLALFAESSPTRDREYEQVRKIALRDPRVKAAFENANQRLEAKIVEIDPALKGYVKGQTTVKPMTPPPARTKPSVKTSQPKAATAHGNTHVIAAGDTLSSIATHYKVSVMDLKKANPNADEKKLRVGQKLTIPSHHESVSVEKNAWERLKGAF